MEVVPRAIAVAFSSRNTPLSATERLLGGHFGHSRNSRRGWRRLRRDRNERDIPASLEETVVEVAERLRPLIAAAQSA